MSESGDQGSASALWKVDEFTGGRASQVLFRAIAGSHSYGLAGPGSDQDIRGIYAVPAEEFLSLQPPPAQISDERSDIVYFALHRYLALAANANPNILELLYTPSDCVLFQAPEFEVLLKHRADFVTRKTYETFVAYGMTQIKRSRGQNKWVHNPQPAEPPSRESFCWFIPRKDEAAGPYRPQRLADCGLDLSRCHAAAVEHSVGLYRIYDYGPSARGVFRGGRIVCESIPMEDESDRCIGLLLYNDQAYECAHRDHTHYWKWFHTRNPERWRTQMSGELDYDSKNLMHTIRLLLCGKHILTAGEPKVRFEGQEREFLLEVRGGKFAIEELLIRSDELVAELAELHDKCRLPDSVPAHLPDQILKEITARWERRLNLKSAAFPATH
jgi:predicted nucleotidyltransferase